MGSRDLDPDVARRMGREVPTSGTPFAVKHRKADPFPIQGPPSRRWRVILVAAVVVLLPPAFTLVYYGGRTSGGGDVRLMVAAVPDDAVVEIDGVQIAGPSPKVLGVRPGQHLVTVKRDGFDRFDRILDLSSGGDVNLPVILTRSTAVPDAAAPPTVVTAPPPPPSHRPPRPAHTGSKHKAAASPAPKRPGVLYLDLKTGSVR